ncbi:MAG TPA: SAM-dependent methyltransferase [Rugosimonospora sp.]|nr:SAM-dependent methyltransferase [Rugosimonospora sp.]
MERPAWVTDSVDVERPSQARAYDYLLGGSHNLAVDREVARQAIALMPDVAMQAQANRAFLHRAVRFLIDSGIRQFLDIGSGIPTVGNVHEVAQRLAPQARVVYVDADPVAVLHSRQLLLGNADAVAIEEDLRDPERILDHPDLRAVLDLERPVAVLLLAILHAIPDAADPAGAVARLLAPLPAGSYMAVSHATYESLPEIWARLAKLSEQTDRAVTPRSYAQIERFFDGLELVEPGLVWAPLWRPESPDDVGDAPERSSNYAGVGRKV